MWPQAYSIVLWGGLLGLSSGAFGARIRARQNIQASSPYDHAWIESFTALGDSYAVGLGAGHIINEPAPGMEINKDCYQYSYGYPNLLNSEGMLGANPDRNFQYFPCSGALAENILKEQVPKMPGSVDLVTLSAGGNDAHLAAILNRCIFTWTPNFWPGLCEGELKAAMDAINSDKFSNDLRDLITAIHGRMPSSNARVYWTGYERFWDITTNECDQWSWSMSLSNWQYLLQDRRRTMNNLVDAVNDKIKKACSLSDKCVFVDTNPDIDEFWGHYCHPGVDEYAPPLGGSHASDRPETWFYNWGTTKDNDDDSDGGVDQPQKRGAAEKRSLADVTISDDNLQSTLARFDNSTFEGAIANYVIQGLHDGSLNASSVANIPDFTAQGSLLPDSLGRIFHLNKQGNSAVANRILGAMAVEQAKLMGEDLVTTTLSACQQNVAAATPAPSPTRTAPWSPTGTANGLAEVDECHMHLRVTWDCGAVGSFHAWAQFWDAAGNELLGISPSPDGPGTVIDSQTPQHWNAHLQDDIVITTSGDENNFINFQFGNASWTSQDITSVKPQWCVPSVFKPDSGPKCPGPFSNGYPAMRDIDCYFGCPFDPNR